MTWINTITDYPNQVLTLVLPGGTNIQFSLWYSDGQQGWLYSFTYGTFSISNKRIVVGANLLRAFRNLLPFGIAVTTTDGYEVINLNDFSSGRASLYLLDASDVAEVESTIIA